MILVIRLVADSGRSCMIKATRMAPIRKSRNRVLGPGVPFSIRMVEPAPKAVRVTPPIAIPIHR